MDDEIEPAVAPWRAGDRIDLYAWARAARAARRHARAVRPRPRRPPRRPRPGARVRARARLLRRASTGCRSCAARARRWPRCRRARARLDGLIHGEIARRRAQRRARRGPALAAARRRGRGRRPAVGRARPRRGHDAAVRRPRHDDRDRRVPVPRARPPPGRRRRDRRRAADARRLRGADGRRAAALDRALDETLRLYPPAWIGPRRAVAHVRRSPASPSRRRARQLLLLRQPPPARRLGRPASVPARALRARARGALPKGAYVPFGAGSRQCIGMRFGQLEIKAIAARILREHRLELAPGHRLEIRQTPTLGPARRDADARARA